MRLILTPSRHAVAMKPGERHPTIEEKLAEIAASRRKMVTLLKKHFPQVSVLGIDRELEKEGAPPAWHKIAIELDSEFKKREALNVRI